MKDYGEVEIHGTPEELQGFVGELAESLTDGWSRDREGEQLVMNRHRDVAYRFQRDGRRRRLPCLLILAHPANSGTVLHVANIRSEHEAHATLDYDEFNAILSEFFEFVRPVADSCGLRCFMGGLTTTIEDYLGPESLSLLERFIASPGPGRDLSRANSYDYERWLRFVFSVHRKDEPLGHETFKRALVEDMGLREDQSSDAASELSTARSILRHYDAFLKSNSGAMLRFQVECPIPGIQQVVELPAFPRIGEEIDLYASRRLYRFRASRVGWANASFLYSAELELAYPNQAAPEVACITYSEGLSGPYARNVKWSEG